LFITLKDEIGLVNLIIQPNLYGRNWAALHNAVLLPVAGCLQREDAAISLVAGRITR